MAVPKASVLSEYERKRQEQIAKNQALFKHLNIAAASVGIAPKKPAAPKPVSKRATRRSDTTKEKDVQEPQRKSLRLLNIQPDNVAAKRKIEEDNERRLEEERSKKRRVGGDLNFGDILASSDSWDANGSFLHSGSRPHARSFDLDKARKTTDKEVQQSIERLNALTLWEDVEPNSLKLTPERVYAATFHPTRDKALFFAGDKYGTLGIFDSAESRYINPEADEEGDLKLAITQLKIHTRSISTLKFHENDPNYLFSSSYDSTIRKLDLQKGVAIEVFAPSESTVEEGISGLELIPSDPNMVYFTTLEGRFGMHDIRQSSKDDNTTMYVLSEKKIGGFSIIPDHPHIVATASLDRTLKIWDLRKISGRGESRVPFLLGEHESRLSVSSASFNYAGSCVTASYDDTVKIYDFSKCMKAATGQQLSEEQLKPSVVVPHNNQTGRWVTILKPRWQLHPQDGIQKFCIGNMNRFVDVYDNKGTQLAQLGGDTVTAVPAVVEMHPSMDWIGGATASGKLCLWM